MRVLRYDWDGKIHIDDLVIATESYNNIRNGWRDIRHVCVKLVPNESIIDDFKTPQCIGMCATIYSNK